MKKIIILMAVAGAAYVLGARNGREWLSRLMKSVRNQGETVSDAVDAAASRVQHTAAAAADQVAETAKGAVDRAVDLAESVSGRSK